MSGFRLRFLTRAGCHLCDEARPLVQSAAARAKVEIDEVDIESSDDLVARYGLRIPVVLTPDDRVIAEGRIEDGRRLRKAIRRSARGGGRG